MLKKPRSERSLASAEQRGPLRAFEQSREREEEGEGEKGREGRGEEGLHLCIP